MRHTRKIRVLFAWLALFALGLTIVAPVVSRTLASVAASSVHDARHTMDMAAPIPAGHADSHPSDHAHVDHDDMLMEQCGYCGLLGHSPLLLVIAWLPGLLPQAAPRQPVPTAPQRGPERSTLTAVPRGPPAFPPG
ncbi:DUF2946 domain-containing protein [Rhodanobacter lindaniclasticus]|uniref:DUF2946 domain-containing protein n=1 Tax=Rhodanobacter lindaniclasticus TaxID=75310 RepID=A0A4S3KKZ8_9GAMM|nr:DUF2946 domain-containing protein [Rhodanobacter lindaniclasticus]ODT90023.1 MAG: hypothetical protein ABS82_17245 [Rhodanobacter sp. SCN 67-45]THD08724.1 hypothetical protein B1991_05225 [Rhodanobacter lindaniclasticus]